MEQTTLKLLFFVKRNEVKPDGTCPIMGRITIGDTMAQFSCKLSVSATIWDTRANRASGKSKAAVRVNRELDAISVSVNRHFRQITELRSQVTATEVKNAFQGIASAQKTLISAFVSHNGEIAKLVGVTRTAATLTKYNQSLNRLREFLALKMKVSDIPFPALNLQFIQSYQLFLKVDKKYRHNTICHSLFHLLAIVKKAVEEGLIAHNPFIGFEVGTFERKQRYLTKEQIDQLISTSPTKPYLHLTKDMFLFAIFTGLSYRDAFNLTKKNIVKADDGRLWIKTARQKTKSGCEIPLLPIAEQIISKYAGLCEDGRLLPMPSNWLLDKQLKVLAKQCGISRNLAYHDGRHSYATTICLSNGVPIESVSRMLGHSRLTSTQIYARTTQDKIAEDISRAEEYIEKEFDMEVLND